MSCLVPHVVERVYFPHARELQEASEACGEAYETARQRDGGHGWYHTPEGFLSCLWTAEEPYPGLQETLPREAMRECIIDGELIILGEGAARLESSRFFWDMIEQNGRWVFDQLLLKP